MKSTASFLAICLLSQLGYTAANPNPIFTVMKSEEKDDDRCYFHVDDGKGCVGDGPMIGMTFPGSKQCIFPADFEWAYLTVCNTTTDLEDSTPSGSGFQFGPSDPKDQSFYRTFSYYFTNEKREKVACKGPEDPEINWSCTAEDIKTVPSHAPPPNLDFSPDVEASVSAAIPEHTKAPTPSH